MSHGSRLTNSEQQLLTRVTQNRRQRVLSIVVPGLCIDVLYTLLIVDKPQSTAYDMLLGMGAGVLILTILSMILRQTTWATGILVFGMTGWTGFLIYLTGPSTGQITLQTLQSFFLFLIPIIIAGILSEPVIVAITTIATFVYSILMLVSTPLATNVQHIVTVHGNDVLLKLPLFSQVGLGFLLIAGAFGFQRMQRELVAWRIAYSREVELDHLREQFIASINHELRNPIMAVQSYFILAKELGEKGDAMGQQRMLTRGAEVSALLAQMVESILSVRRLKTPQENRELISVDVYGVMTQVTHMSNMLDVRGQHHIQEMVPKGLTVIADEKLLLEVFSNLVTNAAKYSPSGTEIIVAAREVSQREVSNFIPMHLEEAKGPMIEVTIKDYGVGIPPDKAPLIFEPFVRLERDEQSHVVGSGLGLSICRAHIQVMQGAIWVESTGVSGEGSTFHVLLMRGQPLNNTVKLNRSQGEQVHIE